MAPSYIETARIQDGVAELRDLITALQSAFEQSASAEGTLSMISQIEQILASGRVTDTLLLSDAAFLLGFSHMSESRYRHALEWFSKSAGYRERIGIYDRRYASCLSNMSVASFKAGDYNKALTLGEKAMVAKRTLTVADSSSLASNYLNLASINLELNDSEIAIRMAEAGLELSRLYPQNVPISTVADLYQVIALSLYRNSEYTRALDYSREALRLYDLGGAGATESRQLMLNTISQLYRRLNQPDEAEAYFLKGLANISKANLSDNYLLYINYAAFLSERGRLEEGEEVIRRGLRNVIEVFGENSREYCLMMASNASFIRRSGGDNKKAIDIYKVCMNYLESHPWDLSLKRYVMTDYAETLMAAGMYTESLMIVDEVLESANVSLQAGEESKDTVGGIEYSENTLFALTIKYKVLNFLSDATGAEDYLLKAVETGKSLLSLYDQKRLEMSEEESRNNLSAYARDYYTGMIANFAELYSRKPDPSVLADAFIYSEKSKVAGFLASVRELNAARFSLPDELVRMESDLKKKIGTYREFIANEKAKAEPDSLKIASWEMVTFGLLRSRDSLIQVFEQNYPAYYSLRFKSDIVNIHEVNDVLGREANLISYLLSDNRLYIFIVNKNNSELLSSEVDSAFFEKLSRLKELLSTVPEMTSVREPFNEYMDLAWELYSVLLKPAVPFINGDKIIISPDNILSYIPFETLVTESFRSDELLYRDAPFALKKYRFSYIYSVTLSSEIQKRSRRFSNNLLAFAPSYENMEISDSVLTIYPNLRGRISALPYAREEAEDAVRQCGGILYTGGSATEEAYKKEASGYNIIHLAMHTLINDLNPAYSKMLFSGSKDNTEDGFLNTYEVYGIPLTAKMIVLSSCNTGSGMLMTGEGILSLARGFLFAGSRSVVMSMWEVEDFSGSSVVKSFYKSIRRGENKSTALRNARLRFLREADQARSHPYYWATLVVYGDDTPIYYSNARLFTGLLVLLIASVSLTALIYRGPSS